MGKNGEKEISFENDCYIVALSKSVFYSDSPVLSDTDKKNIIDLSNNFNEGTHQSKILKVFGSDSMVNIIELYAVNGNNSVYDIDTTEQVEQVSEHTNAITSDEPINNQQSNSSSVITDSDYDNIKKLKTLLDDGILTQEEFDAKLKSRFWNCILMAAYIKLYKIR